MHPMRIGIISDTHDQHANVRKAIEVFAAQGVAYVLHAGDITGPSTVSLFAQLPGVPLIAVLGNCDTERAALHTAVRTAGGQFHGRVYEGNLDGRAIYMTHVPHEIDRVVGSGKYDLVVYGHTHRQDICQVGKTLLVNPGAARNWMGDPPEVVVVDLADMTATTHPLA
jgi:hypothetical protein